MESAGMQLCAVMMVVCGKGFIHGAEPHDKHINVHADCGFPKRLPWTRVHWMLFPHQ